MISKKSPQIAILSVLAMALVLSFSSVSVADENLEKSDAGNYNAVQDPNSNVNEVDRYNAHYYKLLFDGFERAGEWYGMMAREYGVVRLKRHYGGAEQLLAEEARERVGIQNPLATVENTSGDNTGTDPNTQDGKTTVRTPPLYKRADGKYEERYLTDYNYPEAGLSSSTEVTADEGNVTTMSGATVSRTITNARVLGVKVTFFRRGYSNFTIKPPEDLWIDGVAKGIEVYVNGRQKPHTLYAMFRDVKGREISLKLTDLTFLGWRRISVPIPPTIKQVNSTNPHQRGLYFTGFRVEADPMAAQGNFFMYLDNLSFLVDRYYEETQSQTQLSDLW